MGEDFIRNAIAFSVSAQMEYANSTLKEAVSRVLQHPHRKISGGILAVSASGKITMQFNTVVCLEQQLIQRAAMKFMSPIKHLPMAKYQENQFRLRKLS